tara:strand:+ start:34056 stop:35102 length:1047 start_codon:yes stop_codon:yes gene_type:complete
MYKYAPQMEVYDRYTHEWKPFVMFSNKTNLKSKRLNTDKHGLRFNGSNEKFNTKSIFEQGNNSKEHGAVFGASTAYGLGASSDDKTISSILSKETNIHFFNLGVTAFSGFQEVILHQSLINHLEKIKYIVVLSGYNDLYMLNYLNNFDVEYGPHYYANQFKIGMDNSLLNRKRKIAKFFFSPFLDKNVDWSSISQKQILKMIFNKREEINNFNEDEKDNLIKNYLNRNLIYWSNIQKLYNVKILYVLQPVFGWCNKNLSLEEKEIFEELDINNLKVYDSEKTLENSYEKYLNLVSKHCEKYRINFVDSNQYFRENNKKDNWCFIDRSHLTDLGNQYISNVIKAKLLNS